MGPLAMRMDGCWRRVFNRCVWRVIVCEDEAQYARMDGKEYARTGKTFFQPREYYETGTPEGLAFDMGYNIEKKRIERENDQPKQRPYPVGD